MNKKGFIRTIEAVIAILVLLGLVLFIFGDKPTEIKKTPEVVESALSFITSEFLYNELFRNCFSNLNLDTNNGGECESKLSSVNIGNVNCKTAIVDQFLRNVDRGPFMSIPTGYDFKCEVCKTTRSCETFTFPEDKSVYPKSVFIYKSKDDKEEARVVRIYLFEKA